MYTGYYELFSGTVGPVFRSGDRPHVCSVENFTMRNSKFADIIGQYSDVWFDNFFYLVLCSLNALDFRAFCTFIFKNSSVGNPPNGGPNLWHNLECGCPIPGPCAGTFHLVQSWLRALVWLLVQQITRKHREIKSICIQTVETVFTVFEIENCGKSDPQNSLHIVSAWTKY